MFEKQSQSSDSKADLDLSGMLDGALAHAEAQEEHASLMEEVLKMKLNGELEAHKFPGVKDYHAERVVDSNIAGEWHQHHMQLNRASEVARKLFAVLSVGVESQTGKKILDRLKDDLESNGAFFESQGYSEQEIADSILNVSEMILVRAGACIRDSDTAQWNDFQFSSEMKTQIASPDPEVPLITKIPHPDDTKSFYSLDGELIAKPIAEEIHANHSCIAVITDVSTYRDEYRGRRIAGMARQETNRIITDEVNAHRPIGREIKYLIANMFRVEGIKILDKQERPNGNELQQQ